MKKFLPYSEAGWKFCIFRKRFHLKEKKKKIALLKGLFVLVRVYLF